VFIALDLATDDVGRHFTRRDAFTTVRVNDLQNRVMLTDGASKGEVFLGFVAQRCHSSLAADERRRIPV